MEQEKRHELNEKLSLYFNTINTMPVEIVLRFLCTESPLKAMLVIAVLESKKAAFALEHIPEQVQQSIVAALAHGIRLTPNMCEHIMASTVETLQQLDEKRRVSVGFMEKFQDIMPLLNSRTVKSISDILKEMDTERYNELHPFIVTLDDIMLLDDLSVQRVLRDVDISWEELAAALIGAPESLIEKIKHNMSKRAAMNLKKPMKMQDALLRLIDPETVQDIIAGVMRKLVKAGEIKISQDEYIL